MTLGTGFHLAFAARSHAEVEAFHGAALAHGGVDDGAPGLRDQYGPGYYPRSSSTGIGTDWKW